MAVVTPGPACLACSAHRAEPHEGYPNTHRHGRADVARQDALQPCSPLGRSAEYPWPSRKPLALAPTVSTRGSKFRGMGMGASRPGQDEPTADSIYVSWGGQPWIWLRCEDARLPTQDGYTATHAQGSQKTRARSYGHTRNSMPWKSIWRADAMQASREQARKPASNHANFYCV
ncbi:hypothetical protein GQ53DRAFT_751034 [Thozetella sp. PMI_491]|nr:hypothetical protein GQ53DRAFT_751034 [Thozetella sp. PMI_491]